MIEKTYTCIVCPRSCVGTLKIDDDGNIKTEGFFCKNGEEYAINEYKDPRRVLTTTVSISQAPYSLLPVVSSGEISRSIFNDCLKDLYQISVTAPVREGDIIVENIRETGVDIIAARTMERI